MLTLKVEIPEARDRTAAATLREGMSALASGPAVASALSSYAADHANPECDPLRLCGHPALGRYRLIHHEPAPAGQSTHYGSHILLFEPQSGPALEAESFGRLGLLVFGGPPGRRTQGGLRVNNELLKTIVARIAQSREMTLDIVALRPRAWWQFWKSPDATSQPLSSALNPPHPPHDELTLLEALLQKAPRRPRSTRDPDDRDTDDRSSRDNPDDRSDRSGAGDSFRGGGGQAGGAGASGRWSAASGRGPGVDDAGRIVGAAATVGAVAAAAAMASHAARSAPESSGSTAPGASESIGGNSGASGSGTGDSGASGSDGDSGGRGLGGGDSGGDSGRGDSGGGDSGGGDSGGGDSGGGDSGSGADTSTSTAY